MEQAEYERGHKWRSAQKDQCTIGPSGLGRKSARSRVSESKVCWAMLTEPCGSSQVGRAKGAEECTEPTGPSKVDPKETVESEGPN